MKRHLRPLSAMLLALIVPAAIAACGGSSSSSSSAARSRASATATSADGGSGRSAGTVSEVMGVAPQSLDPAADYSTQGAEMNWLVYTGVVTYKHTQGNSSVELIPGLARALPRISNGGKTYTATLRTGLKFSSGQPVRASDFTYAIERAIKLPWGGAGQFLTPVIVGASAFSTGKAKTISGITADDRTGKITIRLVKPYGPFDNVLAFPAVGLIPNGTPFKVQSRNPPPGVGPYRVTNLVPGRSWSMVKNANWTPIPGIPSGHANVKVKISANLRAEVLSVVDNRSDVMDWADVVPRSLLLTVRARANDRFSNVNLGGSTDYLYMNVTSKPFRSQLAREAVATGLNRNAMNRQSSGTLVAACHFLPPAVPGHPTGPCPYGSPGDGNLAKAKALVKQSGMAGAPVTVWCDSLHLRKQWMQYYTSFLNSIGFKATLKVLPAASYFTTIGERKMHPQTGFADWGEDFANPVDFYLLVDGNAILSTDNQNYSEVNDPKINDAIATLGNVPTTQLSTVASRWQAIDEYLARKAYVVVFGYQTVPKLMSSRMNYTGALLNSVYGWDLTSLRTR